MSRSFPHPTAESVAMPQGFGERILRSAITTLALSNNYVPWRTRAWYERSKKSATKHTRARKAFGCGWPRNVTPCVRRVPRRLTFSSSRIIRTCSSDKPCGSSSGQSLTLAPATIGH